MPKIVREEDWKLIVSWAHSSGCRTHKSEQILSSGLVYFDGAKYNKKKREGKERENYGLHILFNVWIEKKKEVDSFSRLQSTQAQTHMKRPGRWRRPLKLDHYPSGQAD